MIFLVVKIWQNSTRLYLWWKNNFFNHKNNFTHSRPRFKFASKIPEDKFFNSLSFKFLKQDANNISLHLVFPSFTPEKENYRVGYRVSGWI